MVKVEIPGAYTDGTSRFDQVFVPDAAVRGKTPEQVRQAVKDVIDDDPLGQLLGATVTQPSQTKPVWEERARVTVDDWQDWQWRLDHVADYPGYALMTTAQQTGVRTAITNRRDAAASRDWDVLTAWRAAAP